MFLYLNAPTKSNPFPLQGKGGYIAKISLKTWVLNSFRFIARQVHYKQGVLTARASLNRQEYRILLWSHKITIQLNIILIMMGWEWNVNKKWGSSTIPKPPWNNYKWFKAGLVRENGCQRWHAGRHSSPAADWDHGRCYQVHLVRWTTHWIFSLPCRSRCCNVDIQGRMSECSLFFSPLYIIYY